MNGPSVRFVSLMVVMSHDFPRGSFADSADYKAGRCYSDCAAVRDCHRFMFGFSPVRGNLSFLINIGFMIILSIYGRGRSDAAPVLFLFRFV